MKRYILTICWAMLSVVVFAQNNLNQLVSLQVKQKKLSDLLNDIGKKGNFYFSYNSNIIPSDSLVTITTTNKPIRTLLDELFHSNIDYKEAPGYIILRPAPNRLTLLPDTAIIPAFSFDISGYVVDDRTGAPVKQASVYEKQLLVSTLTDDRGYFRLKIKSEGVITLTVSKEYYKDTSMNFLSKVTVTINPHKYYYSADGSSGRAERNWLGRAFISSRQKIQSINLGGFVATVPVQTSLVPGWGSHGIMGGQIVNKFSLNVLGGYTAGVNGLEVGGLFNINKQEVKYVQVAGLFNVVGGNMEGIQVAGISNTVFKSVKGVQIAGIFNADKDSLAGLQVAGLLNTVARDSKALQVAGILNYNKANAKGFRVAGIANITAKESNGFQLAGIFNKAHIMKGFSFGIVNVADTLNGCAFGLVNIARNGYHQLLVYNNETTTANIGFKTGNAKLYSIISGGVNLTDKVRFYSYGFGVGHEFGLNKKMDLATETSFSLLQSGSWKNLHQVNRFSVLLNIKTASKFGVFLGPSFNVYHDNGRDNALSEEDQITHNKPGLIDWGQGNKAWFGWTAGFSLF